MKKINRIGLKSIVSSCVSLFFVVTLFYSCISTSKLADGTELPSKVKEPGDFYNKKISYNTFSARASSSYKDDNQSHNFTTHLKMEHSKSIWASVTAVGGILEIARALITPDSIKALIKVEKKAFVTSYKDGLSLLNADVPYPALENLFIGNPLIENAQIQNVENTDSTLTIYVTRDDFVSSLTYDKKTGFLTQQYIKSDKKNFSCELLYYNYKELSDKQLFSFKRVININNKGKPMILTLDFNKADINVPVEYNLNIPSNFTLIQNPRMQ